MGLPNVSPQGCLGVLLGTKVMSTSIPCTKTKHNHTSTPNGTPCIEMCKQSEDLCAPQQKPEVKLPRS